MVLEALERELRSEKAEKITIHEKLTVEHLMPQQWEAHWSLPSEDDSEAARIRRNIAIHTIGNLTLVTGKLNPSMSNGSWEKKRQALKKHTILSLNQEFDGIETWDEEAISERSSMLFDVAIKTWPYPGA